MFCVHCGKSNVENARFCAHCGKAINQPLEVPSPKSTEWEYYFYSTYWESGKGGRWSLTFGVTEASVRLDNWWQDQNWIMPQIQKIIDEGWEYVTPPGPNSYNFETHTDSAGGIKFKWLSVRSFIADFRRPARPLKEKEKNLIGTWQETEDPNKGFWKKLLNIVFAQKLTVNKETIDFHKDHTFTLKTSLGISKEGVFYEYPSGEIELLYKHYPDQNSTVTIENGKLYRNLYSNPDEYERMN